MVKLVGIDTETHLITDEVQIPRFVCMSYLEIRGKKEEAPKLVARDGAVGVLKAFINDGYTFVAHNASFDFAVLMVNFPELTKDIIDLYSQDRIKCTMVGKKLLRLAESDQEFQTSRNSLDALMMEYFDTDISGEKTDPNSWRLRFSELDGKPISEWDEDARRYALDDARYPMRIWEVMESEENSQVLGDIGVQASAGFYLYVMTALGLSIDKEALERLRAGIVKDVSKHLPKLLEAGVINKDKKKEGSDYPYTLKRKVLIELVEGACALAGTIVPRGEPTDKMKDKGIEEGNVKTDKATLEDLAPHCDIIKEYTEITTLTHNQSTYIPALSKDRIYPRYNPFVRTGRTSSSKPNIQNMPRQEGFRECIVPDDKGSLFLAIDYSFIELVGLAFVQSKVLDIPTSELVLYNAINKGRDPHLMTALNILIAAGNTDFNNYESIKLAYDQGCKDVKGARQLAKIPNFGYPGGMGASSLVSYAKGLGYVITEGKAQDLKDIWYDTFPEMRLYFDFVSKNGVNNSYKVEQVGSSRVRGRTSFCSACNSYFQGITADGAKRAISNCSEVSFTDPEYAGCTLRVFVHDEILFHIPDYASEKKRQSIVDGYSKIMVDSMKECLPGMKVGVEATLMRRWAKSAYSPIKNGVLQICENM